MESDPINLVTLPTAPLERSATGTPFSTEFGDIYHSEAGGLAQARHVFLGGNGLPGRWHGRERFTILETGFGLGLNFLAAWDAWRADPQRCARLHFVSIERRPFERTDLASALAPFAELAPLATALERSWPPPLAGFHRIHFDAGRVILTLLFGDAAVLLPQLVARADAFFLDGFAPASERLKNFVDKAAQATLVGDIFDDAATGQGLLNYFIRALNCGAITEDEALATGLTLEELRSRSFVKIMKGRRGNAAM